MGREDGTAFVDVSDPVNPVYLGHLLHNGSRPSVWRDIKTYGHYAYIDNIFEARKVLVNELGATLFTIARDVKIQVEFNPTKVESYRLIGYENRALRPEDFADDRKDAGEIGAGHTVTALYEIVPVGVEIDLPSVDPLKYQRPAAVSPGSGTPELLTVKLRHKEPTGTRSRLQSVAVADVEPGRKMSANLRFSSAVAAFGMLLRDSEHKGSASWPQVIDLARGAIGPDLDKHIAHRLKSLDHRDEVNAMDHLSGNVLRQIDVSIYLSAVRAREECRIESLGMTR